MNPGLLAILIIVGAGGAAAWVAAHRHIIWPELTPKAKPPQMRVRKVTVSEPKRLESAETNVSRNTKPHIDAEMISFQNAYKLIKTGRFTQTEVLCTLFDVVPGGSKAYKEVIEKYKAVAAELDKTKPIENQGTIYQRAKAL